MSYGRFNNPVAATLAGFKDRFRKQVLQERFTCDDRFDGKRVLITGANSGLGFALAVEIAKRGGHVTMACRSQIPQAGERARQLSGSATIEMRECNLSILSSIHDFVEDLVRDGVTYDVILLNAATTLPEARRTECGQDEMFLVNYFANFILVNLVLKRGILRSDVAQPRLIFISSDSHRGASAVDYDEFGRYFEYGVAKAIANYSYFKLILNIFATELHRRLNGDKINVQVNLICPGPVNSNIIKAAPWPLRMVLRAIFTVIFKSPANAALPVVYLAASSDFENRSNQYLHMFSPKEMDEKVYDAAEGERLWQESAALWKRIDPDALDV